MREQAMNNFMLSPWVPSAEDEKDDFAGAGFSTKPEKPARPAQAKNNVNNQPAYTSSAQAAQNNN